MSTASIRALVRVGWRDTTRHRLRSLLVILLIALPVAAMVGGIAILRTTQTTNEREDLARMGSADLQASGVSKETLLPYLPAGSRVEYTRASDGKLVLPGYRPIVTFRALDVAGLGAGMLNLIAGRAPSGADEVAITPSVAALAEVGIGDRLALEDDRSDRSATVVGLVENPMYLDDRSVVFDPGSVAVDAGDKDASWLVGLPEGADPEAIVASTTDPITDAQPFLLQSRSSGRMTISGGDTYSSTILILGSLALVEASLIASAAFAVSVRRRQRELGLLAASGATPSQLATTVVLQAAVLGLLACVVGVVGGLALAFGLDPFLDELTRRRNQPLVLDLAGVALPFVIGFVAALIAAWIPARTVARVPVLLALSGRRPAHAPARRTLSFGIAAVAISALMTIAGATMRNAGSDTASILLLVGGAVLSTLGFGACGPWILERLEALGSRLPLAGRIAFRDTARSRSRSSPIVTAILASCAAVIALGAWTTSRDAESLRGWVPSTYNDQAYIAGNGAIAAGEELLDEPGVLGGAAADYLVPPNPNVGVMFELVGARDASGKLINLAAECIAQGNCEPDMVIPYQVDSLARATPELLAIRRAPEGVAEAVAAGRAVAFTREPVTATALRLSFFDPETNAVLKTVSVPVTMLIGEVPGGTLPGAFLPDATIREMGLEPMSDHPEYGAVPYIVTFDHVTTDADLDRVRAVAAHYPDTSAALFGVPERPGTGFRFVLIALVLLFAISVTGVAIALGEAESRPEQRSLLALGADPRLRRRIVAARAAVTALLAGVLAVPAGLLPIWGIFVSRGSPLAVPSLEIAAAVIGLPILAILSGWLLSRPIPDWNAFRNFEAR